MLLYSDIDEHIWYESAARRYELGGEHVGFAALVLFGFGLLFYLGDFHVEVKEEGRKRIRSFLFWDMCIYHSYFIHFYNMQQTVPLLTQNLALHTSLCALT